MPFTSEWERCGLMPFFDKFEIEKSAVIFSPNH
jgi:hypothetical protein